MKEGGEEVSKQVSNVIYVVRCRKMNSNALDVVVQRGSEMFELACKSKQGVYVVFEVVSESVPSRRTERALTV